MQTFKNVQMNGCSWHLKHGPVHFTVLKKFVVWMVRSFFKKIRIHCWAVLPQTRLSSFHGVEKFFRLDVMQPFKNIEIDGWAALPYIVCHGPAHFAALKIHFVLMLGRLWTTFKWTAGRGPPNTVQLISRTWKSFSSDGMKLSKNNRINGWAVLLQTRPSFFHGVKKPLRLDVMQRIENIQIYGWPALPNILCHGPPHFAALKSFLLWMLCRLLTTFNWTAGRVPPTRSRWFHGVEGVCRLDGMKLSKNIQTENWAVFHKHGPFFFTVLMKFFVLMLCSHLKTFKLIAGPRSPTSPATAQLIPRRSKNVWSWC